MILRRMPSALAKSLAAERAEHAKARELLRELEWSKDDRGWICCPICDGALRKGHEKDCELAAALSNDPAAKE